MRYIYFIHLGADAIPIWKCTWRQSISWATRQYTRVESGNSQQCGTSRTVQSFVRQNKRQINFTKQKLRLKAAHWRNDVRKQLFFSERSMQLSGLTSLRKNALFICTTFSWFSCDHRLIYDSLDDYETGRLQSSKECDTLGMRVKNQSVVQSLSFTIVTIYTQQHSANLHTHNSCHAFFPVPTSRSKFTQGPWFSSRNRRES